MSLTSEMTTPEILPYLPYLCFLIPTSFVLYLLFIAPRRELLPDVPLVLGSSKSLIAAKYAYLWKAQEIIASGLAKFERPFQILTPIGPQIIIPHKYIDEIKNHPDLSSAEALEDQMLGHLDGFGQFKEFNPYNSIMQVAIRRKLSPAQGLVIGDLADETNATMEELLGTPDVWKVLDMEAAARKVVTRLSTRVFLGPELCKNKEWLQLIDDQPPATNSALSALYVWPSFMRGLVNKILPQCQEYHRIHERGRKLIMALADERRQQYRDLEAGGQPLPKVGDNITWMDELAQGKSYDLAGAQLFMSLAANPTATDMLTSALYELCAHPEFFEPLRQEISAAMVSSTWDKTFLDRLKLLDSFLREVMRLNPLSCVAMQRKATKDITFKDGNVIPKGAPCVVSMQIMKDPDMYPEPDKFDPYRALNATPRASDTEKFKFITPDQTYLGFGYGKHTCPGRFFAVNELKVALCYLLMQYDWRTPGGPMKPSVVAVAVINKKDPNARILYKRRQGCEELFQQMKYMTVR